MIYKSLFEFGICFLAELAGVLHGNYKGK